MEGSPGLRERKKAETRQAIADAALGLALELGPGAVTVDDIAAAAGVSVRTVFNYFGTKEAAILGVDPERRAELLSRLAARPHDEDPLQSLREALRGADPAGAIAWRTRANLARQHPQLLSAYLASFVTLEDELADVIRARLAPAVAGTTYPRLLAIVALTTMRVGIDAAIEEGLDVDAAVDAAFAVIASGLAPPG